MQIATTALFMLVMFAGVLGLVLWAVAAESKRSYLGLQRLADTLALAVPAQVPSLGIFYREARASGRIREKFVEVYPFSTGSGKSRVQWSAIAATPKSTGGLTFHLRLQGFGTKVMEVFGSREIEIGDAEFDRRWFIQTNQPDFLRAALVPELRDKVTALARDAGARGLELQLDSGVVRYAEHGSFSDPRRAVRIERAADVVCDLADLAEVFASQKT
ncbi:MAG: hypothetical protein JWM32_2477 [Verrucomicrobia bacterium]|nr:hypothetical protein [Verrucomicrobiota bacterium]